MLPAIEYWGTGGTMTAPKILVFAGSIRTGAFSGKLAAAAAKELALNDADVTLISLADYEMPIYNGDLEKEKGVPENGKKLARQIAAHQGVFIATPEYNNTIPPLLKNSIDWVSRLKGDDIYYRHRVYGIGSSSDGPVGGARALIDLRKSVMNALGAILIPEKVEVGRASQAFDESGNLVAEAPAKLLSNLCKNLVTMAGRLTD
jgi:chromate reductase, NAD(P)H dehydrogenase (quinone)